MTELEKMEAWEQKVDMHIEAHGRCFFCNKLVSIYNAELAHRVPKAKPYLKEWGPDVIHHKDNLRITCSKCNSKALLDPKTHPVEAEEHLKAIKIKVDIGI